MSEFAGQTCGVYPRVSTTRQANKDKSSLADQENACRAYAAKLDMHVDEQCVRREAYTSTQMSRPELNQLLRDMKARNVPNLIIDTADRLSRAGQSAAFKFLMQFSLAGITLHVVSLNLIVREDDEDALEKFLAENKRAKADNDQRALKSRRGKRSRALDGIFNRGNHAPYGYRYVATHDEDGNVTGKRVVPDLRSFAERGFLTIFAENAYAARQKILSLYVEQSWTYGKIAQQLDADHVPTTNQLLKRRTRGGWWSQTVKQLIQQPINQGKLVNHFTEDSERKGEFITEVVEIIPQDNSLEPLITEEMATLIKQRRALDIASVSAHTSIHANRALLTGTLGRCGNCGASLYPKGVRHANVHYVYYACRGHEKQKIRCPGMRVPTNKIDRWIWYAVLETLFDLTVENDEPYLARVLELDRKRSDARPASVDDLPTLRKTATALRDKYAFYVDQMGVERQSQRAVDEYKRKMQELEPHLDDVEQQLAEAERQEAMLSERVKLLEDFSSHFREYLNLLTILKPSELEDVPIMTAFMRAVGAKIILSPDVWRKHRTTGNEPEIVVDITLTPSATLPWLDRDDMHRMLQERQQRVVTSETSRAR